MKTDAIGVFDSGVGGLSVLREIRALVPNEDLIYVADSGAAPYGDRTEEFIMCRVESISGFLLSMRVKAMVIACNTATAVAVDMLRQQLTIPVIAIEPAVKPAASVTKTGVIGVLATSRTLASESFARLAEHYCKDVQYILQPCPGLVEQIEKGDLDSPFTRALITRYVDPLLQRGADTLVLGCTHYPFLRPVIQEVAGPGVTILDPAGAVARQVFRRLQENDLLSNQDVLGADAFWTSGEPKRVEPVISRLWGEAVNVHALPATYSVALPCQVDATP